MAIKVDSKSFPVVDVAVALVPDKARNALLEYDAEWRGFAFPMSKIRETDTTWEQVAGRAAAEAVGCLYVPKLVCELPDIAVSWPAQSLKHYNFKVFLCEPIAGEFVALKTVLWAPIETISDETVQPLHPTARHLAREIGLKVPGFFKDLEGKKPVR